MDDGDVEDGEGEMGLGERGRRRGVVSLVVVCWGCERELEGLLCSGGSGPALRPEVMFGAAFFNKRPRKGRREKKEGCDLRCLRRET
jgi:hypothetical protein